MIYILVSPETSFSKINNFLLVDDNDDGLFASYLMI